MADRLSGGDIGIMVASNALGEVLSWESEERDVDTPSTAAGDPTVDNTHLRTDFVIKGECLLAIASPYVVPTGLVGTKVAVKLKVVSADVNGFVSCSSAKVNRFVIGGAVDGMIKYSFELGAARVPLAYDLTPAT